MKKLKIFEIIGLIVILSLTVLAGISCAAQASTGTLEGVTWVLKSYGNPDSPAQALADTEVTLIFDKETKGVGGNGGVNVYGGDYTIDGNELTISGLIHTLIYGPEPQQNQEDAFFKLLESAQSYKIDAGQLTITGTEGVLVFYQK